MYSLDEVKAVDKEVAAAIEAEMARQNSHIELIASENWEYKARSGHVSGRRSSSAASM